MNCYSTLFTSSKAREATLPQGQCLGFARLSQDSFSLIDGIRNRDVLSTALDVSAAK